MSLEKRSEHRAFDGVMGFYSHASKETGTKMNFSVFVPPQAREAKIPALYYLAGLTCTEETFMIKAGAQRFAAAHGLMLVACDTSPRTARFPGDADSWDFGIGAGFYLDATQDPWKTNYRMGSYVNAELPSLIEQHFPARNDVRGIFGHSMGGHGALVTALKYPERWRSVSAFAPIANPSAVPWGEKAFSRYLGEDRAAWSEYDASILLARRSFRGEILVDQGTADQFLAAQLHPEALEAAAHQSATLLKLRRHEGYDHSYYFISTFIADHLAHHATFLTG